MTQRAMKPLMYALATVSVLELLKFTAGPSIATAVAVVGFTAAVVALIVDRP